MKDLPEADVVEGFVIDAVGLVGVFNELMDGEGGVVWFDNGIRYLWRWDNREGVHDSVWVFFSDFGDEKCTHTGTGTTTERVGKLESLKYSRLDQIILFIILPGDNRRIQLPCGQHRGRSQLIQHLRCSDL